MKPYQILNIIVLLAVMILAICFVSGRMAMLSAGQKPYHDDSMPTVTRAQDGGDVIIMVNQPAPLHARIEVQRKLFPWGWRYKGSIRGTDIAFRDTKPAKRIAWYRIRLVYDDGTKGVPSRPVKFEPKKQ